MIGNNYYISFVVTTRNDDHGKNMFKKNQFFLDMWADKVKKYKIESELVIVEWNPDSKKSLLKDTLIFPKLEKNQSIRIITVSNDEHKKFQHSDKLKIFQMIAKNVGIKRSKSEFILVTNIDIIFSDEFFEFLSKKKLREDVIYRCDRYDIDYNEFNTSTFNEKEVLKNCTLINKKYFSINTKTNKKNYVQISIYSFFNSISKTIKKIFTLKNYKEKFVFRYIKRFGFIKLKFKRKIKIIIFLIVLPISRLIKYYFRTFIIALFKKKIHTNACGDFTLSSKKTWFDLNGYYEFEGYSWHVDSIFLFKALSNNKKFINLEFKIFHINQTDKTSGYIAGENDLFKMLQDNQIQYIDDQKIKKIIDLLNKNPEYLDKRNWGLENKNLSEYKIN